ncbi:MAG: 30S ribosomal protein S4 [Pseudomonadota bacterium]
MARYTDSVCRLCRREALKLFLKGDRCYTDKCAFEKRPYSPGARGQGRRSKRTEYGLMLREKQRAKQMYGVLEKQFKLYFKMADSQKGVTGENLLVLLERRLDNMVYRLGFAHSRNQSRQLVRHSHVKVNGKTVNIPSYLVKEGDEIVVSEASRKLQLVQESIEAVQRRGVPEWLMLEKEKFSGKVMALPKRDQLDLQIQEHLIVELYSK